MQLLLTSPGVLLAQENNCFLLRKDDQKKLLSPLKVQSIVVAHYAQITSQAIVLAMEHNIDLAILDKFGDPIGRFWYARQGRNATLRRKQLSLSSSAYGFRLGAEFVCEKIQAQRRFLRKLADARPQNQSPFLDAIALCDDSSQQIHGLLSSDLQDLLEEHPPFSPTPLSLAHPHAECLSALRALIMGFEGKAAQAYFRCLSELLPAGYRFEARTRRPARDPFNAMLNYAYGILYSRIERACLLAGLDPYVGLFHTEDPHRPALVCDLIEPFRSWADQVVTYLFTRLKAQSEHFDHKPEGVFLNEAGKKLLLPAFNEHLSETIRHKKRNLSRANIPQQEAHRLANLFLQGQLTPHGWHMDVQEF
ncbi:CRISPR-associated endonuclease Cas1 [Myxococcota bacterium]|nr:CRISPR-associated endonuclease Cas1 [Myxococcota bacterium]